MLDLNPVYNYYTTVYSPATQTKYDSHKKSELKNHYNNMIKVNTKSPLFKVKVNNSLQNYVIGLKSAAIGLKNFSEYLTDKDEDTFSKLTASSDNNKVLSGTVITSDYDRLPENLRFQIDSLATNQVNTGRLSNSSQLNLSPGSYSFDINVNHQSFSFQLEVKQQDNNLRVQNRLANAINRSDIGIDAYVEQQDGKSQLILESQNTGTEDAIEEGLLFTIHDDYNQREGLVAAYELANVSQHPTDAVFTINDTEKTSSSNNIAINKMVEIELKKVSSSPVTLSFVPDTEDIINKVQEFADSYNQLVDIAREHIDQIGAKKLLHEMQGIVRRHHSSLEAVGLNIDDDGHIVKDDALLSQNVKNGEVQQFFNDLSGFRADVVHKTDDISLDPMNYVDKTVITYPNPGRAFNNPYMPSIYSGMLYNYYL